MVVTRRLIATPPYYDPKLKAQVIPWAHKLHTYIGYVFVYDDRDKRDELVYLVPNLDGTVGFRVHYCKANIHKGADGSIMVGLEGGPDPENDVEVASVRVPRAL